MNIQEKGKLDEWCSDSIQWLQATFGKDNVVAAHLHMDEKTPHIHAAVVPVVTGERRKAKKEQADSKRKYRKKTNSVRLCADDLFNRQTLIAYHDNYARVMAKYRKSIAENGYQIPAYVYRPKEMPWESQADYDDFTQGLRNYVAGGGMAGTWPVFKDGMEIRTVDNLFKPVDMADLEAREKINEQVCLAFQISPENIGFRTGTNSNIAAYKEKLWNVELLPYLVAFEEALNLTLPEAVGEPDCYIKANLDAKLRGTMETQYQALSTATGRPFMTTDEARELLDRPKLPGGDQLITPLNVSEGGQPSPQDGGQTQNAQQGASPNGKQMLAEFKRLYTYDAGFRASWDSMTKGETSDES